MIATFLRRRLLNIINAVKKLVYYGRAPSLSQSTSSVCATTIENYALLNAGGSSTSTVDAYDDALTKRQIESPSVAREFLAATTVGDYALFGGGNMSIYTADTNRYETFATVDAYNGSLTRTTPTALSVKRYSLAATTVGGYALFGGGALYSPNYDTYYATVDAYNGSLTRTTPTALSVKRSGLAATTVGGYALFGGGNIYTSSLDTAYATVDAYSNTLTRTTPHALSVAKAGLAATTVGDYALFGGDNASKIVDAFDGSLTWSMPDQFPNTVTYSAATTLEGFAIFVGYSSNIYVYDESLTRINIRLSGLSNGADDATTIGNYALFGGGRSFSNPVFAYTIK